MAGREPPLLETLLRDVFVILDDYAILDDDKIIPCMFKKLVHQQLPHFMKNLGDLDEKMRSLDVNNDKKLEFGKFWQLLGEVVMEIKREEVGKKK